MPVTICKSNQLRLAYSVYTESFCSQELICESYEQITERERNISFPKIDKKIEIFQTDRLTFQGIDYAIGMFLVSEIGHDDLLNFAKIQDIFF